MKSIKLKKSNLAETVKEAGTVIKNGGIVIAPFDTVYGLICSPMIDMAVNKIFKIKKRPSSQTIGIAVSSISKLKQISKITAKKEKFISERTPGKFTFIIPDGLNDISDLCKRNNTLGVRIPNSSLIQGIIDQAGGIIAQTSANITGSEVCYSIKGIKEQFINTELNKIDLIIDGGIINSIGASQIIDLTKDNPAMIERKV